MKATKISYSRLVNKGNFEHAKIEIELQVEDGETAKQVFDAAKTWVNNRCENEKLSDYAVNSARLVLEDRRNHTIAQVEDAEKIIEAYSINDGDLPF